MISGDLKPDPRGYVVRPTVAAELKVAWYRRLPCLLQAVEVTHSNMRRVSDWIRANGGAVAGLDVVDTGPIQERKIRFGTLEGIMDAPVGWWILMDTDGGFTVNDPSFPETHAYLQPALGSSLRSIPGRSISATP